MTTSDLNRAAIRQRLAELRAASLDAGTPTSALSTLALSCAADVGPLLAALDAAEEEISALTKAALHGDELARRINGALYLANQVDPTDAARVSVFLDHLRLTLTASRDTTGAIA